MAFLMRCEASHDRIFPEVQSLYRPSAENSLAAVADTRMGWIQRFAGMRLTTSERLTRLLSLHRAGIGAEQAGNWNGADFYFREVLTQLRSAGDDSEIWRYLAQKLGSGGLKLEAAAVYRRVMDEVFADTHCAFYSGYAEKSAEPEWNARQFFHLDCLAQMLDCGALDNSGISLAPALKDRIAACKKSGSWDAAIRYADELLRRYPQEEGAVGLKATLIFERGMAKLSKADTQSAYQHNAKSLKQPISDLEKFCVEYPDYDLSFELTSHLKHMQAISLANSGQPSDALLANEEALAYWPLEEAERDRNKLSELMQKTIVAADELVKRVARTPNARLTADGWRLKHQAEAGFTPANQFAESEPAKKLRETAYSARVRSTWRRVGLIPPLDRWDERGGKLIEALVQVREMCANAPDRIERCWRELTGADQDLNTIPASSIRQFLSEGRVTPVASPTGETNVPVLPVFSAGRKKDNEPFGYWLFSRQDLFLSSSRSGDRRPYLSVRLHDAGARSTECPDRILVTVRASRAGGQRLGYRARLRGVLCDCSTGLRCPHHGSSGDVSGCTGAMVCQGLGRA